MGCYRPGDVILINVSIDDRSSKKVRPAVVVASGDGGKLSVCPVSSKPASDSVCIPVSIDDFADGGLDLFSESYVLLSRLVAIHTGDVMGKKGRLSVESFSGIASRVRNIRKGT
jgi:mRNA interferase MazF